MYVCMYVCMYVLQTLYETGEKPLLHDVEWNFFIHNIARLSDWGVSDKPSQWALVFKKIRQFKEK